MKKKRVRKYLPAILAGLLSAALPWVIPAAEGITARSAMLAGGGSLFAVLAAAVVTLLYVRRGKKREELLGARCRAIYEPLAQYGEPVLAAEEPQTLEEWTDALEGAGEAVRSRVLAEERADRGFVVQWVQKLQKLHNDMESAAQQICAGDGAAAARLNRDCIAAGSLAEQLLQYFGCAEGNIACNRKKTDLFRVVSDAVVRNAALFNTKRIGLRRSVAHLYSVTDATVLALVLDQLLDNAVRYTAENGVIGISCRDAGDTIRLSVEDAGCGIPAEEFPKIFERGYTGKREQPVSPGMGLFTVRSYLELLGHGLEVRSAEGRGTQVIILLKKEEAPSAASEAD